MGGRLVETDHLGGHRAGHDVGDGDSRLSLAVGPRDLFLYCRGSFAADHRRDWQQSVRLDALDPRWGFHFTDLRVCEDRVDSADRQVSDRCKGRKSGVERSGQDGRVRGCSDGAGDEGTRPWNCADLFADPGVRHRDGRLAVEISIDYQRSTSSYAADWVSFP